MDLVTQGIVGAAMASSAAPAREGRRAALIGLGAGVLPDADTLIRSAEDPLLMLEYHRHFTHALVMVPVVALVAAAAYWLARRAVPFLRRTRRRHAAPADPPPLAHALSFGRVYGYALLGASLAGVLDACTSYGTHLWWPFVDAPVAWSLISILDPAFTLLAAGPLALGLVRRRRGIVRWGLALAAAYLLVGAVQHHRAEAVAQKLAAERGHTPERLIVKPTIANLVLWRAITVTGERIYADAVRVGVGASRVYPGTSAPRYDPQRDALFGGDAPAAIRRDIERFMRVADGVVVRHPERPAVIGDARFAMLPTRLTPMWGLAVDTAQAADSSRAAAAPGQPVRRVVDRSLSPEGRQQFIAMLLGRPLPADDP